MKLEGEKDAPRESLLAEVLAFERPVGRSSTNSLCSFRYSDTKTGPLCHARLFAAAVSVSI